MTIRIVTDSGAALPHAITQALGITVIPAYIHIGLNSYQDGVDISAQEYRAALGTARTPPLTAVPSPYDFTRAYEHLAAQGATAIVSIHAAAKLSGMWNAARLGAEAVSSVIVTVYDSQQLGTGQGLLVMTAAEAALAGQSVPAITQRLDERIARTYLYMVTYSLESVRRSGRVKLAPYLVGTVAGIKPVLRLYQGQVDVVGRARSAIQAENKVLALGSALSPYEKLGLAHFEVAERFEQFQVRAQPLRERSDQVMLTELPLTVSVHSGPSIALACITKHP